MSFDDLKKLGNHITTKRNTRWSEHDINETITPKKPWDEKQAKPKRTWNTKNLKDNAKKLAKGFQSTQDSLRKTFPGIADGSWQKQFTEEPTKPKNKGKDPFDIKW